METVDEKIASLREAFTLLDTRIDKLEERVAAIDDSRYDVEHRIKSSVQDEIARLRERVHSELDRIVETRSRFDEHLEDHAHVEHDMDAVVRERVTSSPAIPPATLEQRITVIEDGYRTLSMLLECQLGRGTREHISDVSQAVEGLVFP